METCPNHCKSVIPLSNLLKFFVLALFLSCFNFLFTAGTEKSSTDHFETKGQELNQISHLVRIHSIHTLIQCEQRSKSLLYFDSFFGMDALCFHRDALKLILREEQGHGR